MDKGRRQVLLSLSKSALLAASCGSVLVRRPLAIGGEHVVDRQKAADLIRSDRVLVIAHRGDSGSHPENTIPAFKSAVEIGSDLVELDYVHTSEGTPLVIHDKTLDRTTDAVSQWGGKNISVSKKTLAELETLDAGSWFDEQFAGTRLPTLDQAIDVIQDGSTTLIERKGGDAKTCVDLLEKKNLIDQVVVQSFDWKYLRDCRKHSPTLVLGALGFDEVTPKKVDEIASMGVQAVGWSHDDMDARWIEEFHKHGLRTWVYTVDDLDRVDELIDAGIDGIITNEPALVKAHLASRQQA